MDMDFGILVVYVTNVRSYAYMQHLGIYATQGNTAYMCSGNQAPTMQVNRASDAWNTSSHDVNHVKSSVSCQPNKRPCIFHTSLPTLTNVDLIYSSRWPFFCALFWQLNPWVSTHIYVLLDVLMYHASHIQMGSCMSLFDLDQTQVQ